MSKFPSLVSSTHATTVSFFVLNNHPWPSVPLCFRYPIDARPEWSLNHLRREIEDRTKLPGESFKLIYAGITMAKNDEPRTSPIVPVTESRTRTRYPLRFRSIREQAQASVFSSPRTYT